MNIQKKNKGFTIIEVVLVLAIAGLIFMMVFIALPALQRSQRDSQRKSDLSRAITALSNYSSSNRGSIPANNAAAWLAFENSNLLMLNTAGVAQDNFIDPSGTNTNQPAANTWYEFRLSAANLTGAFDSTANQNVIFFSNGYICNTTNSANITASSSRKVALRMYLEGGGFACQNN